MKKHTDVPVWLRIVLPIAVIVAWIVGAAFGGPTFGKISEVSTFDMTAFLPQSSEAKEVADKTSKFVKSDMLPAVVVFDAKDSEISNEDRGKIIDTYQDLRKVEGVSGDISPIQISEDKKAALVTVPISTGSEIDAVVTNIQDTLKDKVPNTDVYVTGPAGFSADLNEAFAGIDGILLIVALAVVFVILIVVYRSPILPFIVLMTSMFALTVAVLVVYALANADVITLNGQTQGILFILVIGAATDYSLLYVSRFREESQRKAHRIEATKRAWKASVEPILASGGTVIAGLLCLIISDLASNKALGPVGSIGIAMALFSALTFLPAVLALLGRKAFWPFMPKFDIRNKVKEIIGHEKGLWASVGRFVSKHPRRIWITSVVLLLVAATGVSQLKADGVAQSDLILGYSQAREGQSVVKEHFPGGSGTPVIIIAPDKNKDAVVTALDADKGIDSVAAVSDNEKIPYVPLGESAKAMQAPAAAVMTPQFVLPQPKVVDGEVMLQATLVDQPDSDAAKDTIKRIRDETHAVSEGVLVGGNTAAQLDSNVTSIHDRMVIIPLVLAVITVILMLLLRAVVAPILLLLSTVLSFGATLGIAAYLFNGLLGLPGADPSVVLYGFVFLVALGIDYNIFLMTRVREESLKHGTNKGVINGLVVTGGVITSAGVVLAATFAALSVIPILFLGQLAFIVAFGVLLDTIVIRSLLVPALIKDVGNVVWWPSNIKK